MDQGGPVHERKTAREGARKKGAAAWKERRHQRKLIPKYFFPLQ